MNRLAFPKIKDVLLLTGWIGGLICVCSLLWFFSGSLRMNLLRQSVNRAWTRMDEMDGPRRLESPVAPGLLKPGLSRLGAWFNVAGGNRALVFTIITDGIFLPCAAIVNPEGDVEEILPLTASGEKLMNRISPGIIQLHIRRIRGES